VNHPSLEALLAGSEPVRAHAAGCPACAAELAAAERRRSALRALPPLPPPASGWSNLQSTLRRTRRRQVAVRSSLLALAAALGAVVLWPLLHRAPPAPAQPSLSALIARSQALEAELAGLPEPSVVEVVDADTRAEVEDEIEWVDRGLNGLPPDADPSERAGLWKTRIELLEALLEVRRPPAVVVSL